MRRMHKESEGEGGSEGGGGGGDDVEAGDAGTGEEVVDRAVGHDGIVEGEAVSLPVGGHLHGGFGARYAQHIAVVGAALEARQGIATVGTRGREKKHLGAAPHDEVAGRHELSAVAEREKESGRTITRFQHCLISLFRRIVAFRHVALTDRRLQQRRLSNRLTKHRPFKDQFRAQALSVEP